MIKVECSCFLSLAEFITQSYPVKDTYDNFRVAPLILHVVGCRRTTYVFYRHQYSVLYRCERVFIRACPSTNGKLT
jgi:hypothetical protein